MAARQEAKRDEGRKMLPTGKKIKRDSTLESEEEQRSPAVGRRVSLLFATRGPPPRRRARPEEERDSWV